MSLRDIVKNYVREHASIRDCMSKDLIDLKALSARMVDDLKLSKKERKVIETALKRNIFELKAASPNEKKVIEILKKSTFAVKAGINLLVLKQEKEVMNEISRLVKKNVFFVKGTESIALICPSDVFGTVRLKLKKHVIEEKSELAMVTLVSPEEVTTTPGILAYLTSLASEKGINLIEAFSCHRDTIFLVDNLVLTDLIEALRF